MARFTKETSPEPLPKPAATRLYSPSENAGPAAENEAEDEEEAIDVPVHLKNRREMNSFERIGILFCTFVLAGMIVFVLTGYERITRAYAAINTLNSSIDSAKLRISELNVSIECEVTIDQAENAAIAAGMTYPTESQIFSDYQFPSGAASIPIANGSGQAVSADAPSGNDPTADANGTDETDEETLPPEENDDGE